MLYLQTSNQACLITLDATIITITADDRITVQTEIIQTTLTETDQMPVALQIEISGEIADQIHKIAVSLSLNFEYLYLSRHN
jgi:hypothetical protein